MTSPYDQIENPEAWTAWQCLSETNVNIFLTGKAGTGKTTFLKKLREKSPKRMVVVAPTGVAAINAGGVTIHSFFQLPFAPYIPGTHPKDALNMRHEKLNIIRTLDLLVIDEISMVRADILDAIDATLRRVRRNELPFGGVQLLMIGDLQQLSPVVVDAERDMLSQYYPTPYFFSSRTLSTTQYVTIELKHIYRQNDRLFVELLNNIRNNYTDPQTLAALNARYIPDFDPDDSEGYIRLTTHNAQADTVNAQKLKALRGREQTYQCTVEGNFPESSYPADKLLTLKVGAQVMFIKNDRNPEKRYYNGKIGRVVMLAQHSVTVELPESGTRIMLEAEDWTNARYIIDKQTNEIKEEVEGTFHQIPLRLAWAITIHKSQGLTFDKAIIDAQQSFAHGQVYVALSRCRNIQGLVLSRPLTAQSVINDQVVAGFINDQANNGVDDNRINELKSEYALTLLCEMFDFKAVRATCYRIQRIFEESLQRVYPRFIAEMTEKLRLIESEVAVVSEKFIAICRAGREKGIDVRTSPELRERVVGGAKYFLDKIQQHFEPIYRNSNLNVDNKTVANKIAAERKLLDIDLRVKRMTFRGIIDHGFDTEKYLAEKTKAIIDADRNKAKPTAPVSVVFTPSDIEHPILYQRLNVWRRKVAKLNDVKEFTIMSNKTLISIATKLPTSGAELLKIKGISRSKVEKFGIEIIDAVSQYVREQGESNK